MCGGRATEVVCSAPVTGRCFEEDERNEFEVGEGTIVKVARCLQFSRVDTRTASRVNHSVLRLGINEMQYWWYFYVSRMSYPSSLILTSSLFGPYLRLATSKMIKPAEVLGYLPNGSPPEATEQPPPQTAIWYGLYLTLLPSLLIRMVVRP